mgnify:CR=1 FL=1
MSVNLQKGQKVSLKKADGHALTRICVGLGWDPAVQEKKGGGFLGSLFGGGSTQDVDCDASVFVCRGGHLTSVEDIVYFGNLTHASGAIRHTGDNLTGDGEGDDEQILVDLANVPDMYDKLIFVVNIYDAVKRKQDFGMIANAFIRICDDSGEFCRYSLTDSYAGMTALIFGEIYRYNGEWKFNAIGQGTKDKGLNELARRYQ